MLQQSESNMNKKLKGVCRRKMRKAVKGCGLKKAYLRSNVRRELDSKSKNLKKEDFWVKKKSTTSRKSESQRALVTPQQNKHNIKRWVQETTTDFRCSNDALIPKEMPAENVLTEACAELNSYVPSCPGNPCSLSNALGVNDADCSSNLVSEGSNNSFSSKIQLSDREETCFTSAVTSPALSKNLDALPDCGSCEENIIYQNEAKESFPISKNHQSDTFSFVGNATKFHGSRYLVKSSGKVFKSALCKYRPQHSSNSRPLASRRSQRKQSRSYLKKKRKVAVCDKGFIVRDATPSKDQVNIHLENFDQTLNELVPLEVKVKGKLVPLISGLQSETLNATDEDQESIIPASKGISQCKSGIFSQSSGVRKGQNSFSVISPSDCDAGNISCRQCSVPERDICYIFALLDKKNEETQIQCSPELKTSHFLGKLSQVIDAISGSKAVTCAQKVVGSNDLVESHCLSLNPQQRDACTSPVSFLWNTTESSTQCDDQNHILIDEEDSDLISQDPYGGQDEEPAGEAAKPLVNSTVKVIVSKALMKLAYELSDYTDICIRLLKGCGGTVRGEIDSSSIGDEFEGFLCHCHDRVTIMMECLSELDSMNILNIDEFEMKQLWLLHDATCCILQSYRHVNSMLLPASLNQQLISLMITCSKMINPAVRINVSECVAMMEMTRNICLKLLDGNFLSGACNCEEYFERKERICRVCNLHELFEEVCSAGKRSLGDRCSQTTTSNKADATTVEQLFPRFLWFLNEVRSLSEAEITASFSRHTAFRFVCNGDCGLNPCDKHVSVVACECFLPSRSSDPLLSNKDETIALCNSDANIVVSAGSPCETSPEDKSRNPSCMNAELQKTLEDVVIDDSLKTSVKESNVTHSNTAPETDMVISLPLNSSPQIRAENPNSNSSSLVMTTNDNCASSKQHLEKESPEANESCIDEESPEANESCSDEESPEANESCSDATVILSGDSSSSSEEINLKLDDLSSEVIEGPQTLPAADENNWQQEKKNSNCNSTISNQSESEDHLRENDEENINVQNDSSCVDYSHLDIKLARSTIEKAFSSCGQCLPKHKSGPAIECFDSHTTGTSEDGNPYPSEISKPKTDCEVMLGSCQSTSVPEGGSSICANVGSSISGSSCSSDGDDSTVIVPSSPIRPSESPTEEDAEGEKASHADHSSSSPARLGDVISEHVKDCRQLSHYLSHNNNKKQIENDDPSSWDIQWLCDRSLTSSDLNVDNDDVKCHGSMLDAESKTACQSHAVKIIPANIDRTPNLANHDVCLRKQKNCINGTSHLRTFKQKQSCVHCHSSCVCRCLNADHKSLQTQEIKDCGRVNCRSEHKSVIEMTKSSHVPNVVASGQTNLTSKKVIKSSKKEKDHTHCQNNDDDEIYMSTDEFPTLHVDALATGEFHKIQNSKKRKTVTFSDQLSRTEGGNELVVVKDDDHTEQSRQKYNLKHKLLREKKMSIGYVNTNPNLDSSAEFQSPQQHRVTNQLKRRSRRTEPFSRFDEIQKLCEHTDDNIGERKIKEKESQEKAYYRLQLVKGQPHSQKFNHNFSSSSVTNKLLNRGGKERTEHKLTNYFSLKRTDDAEDQAVFAQVEKCKSSHRIMNSCSNVCNHTDKNGDFQDHRISCQRRHPPTAFEGNVKVKVMKNVDGESRRSLGSHSNEITVNDFNFEEIESSNSNKSEQENVTIVPLKRKLCLKMSNEGDEESRTAIPMEANIKRAPKSLDFQGNDEAPNSKDANKRKKHNSSIMDKMKTCHECDFDADIVEVCEVVQEQENSTGKAKNREGKRKRVSCEQELGEITSASLKVKGEKSSKCAGVQQNDACNLNSRKVKQPKSLSLKKNKGRALNGADVKNTEGCKALTEQGSGRDNAHKREINRMQQLNSLDMEKKGTDSIKVIKKKKSAKSVNIDHNKVESIDDSAHQQMKTFKSTSIIQSGSDFCGDVQPRKGKHIRFEW